MKSFLIALQFLTIIPVKIKEITKEETSRAMICFPLVGLLLGLALVGVDKIFLFSHMTGVISNVILIIALVILTGGLHLDGLADTFDAIGSGKSKEEMLTIMRDPHIGTMGTISIICAILLKISFLSLINISLRTNALLLMCILSRWSLVFLMHTFPYVRQEGKVKVFIQGANSRILIMSTLATLACIGFIWKFKALFIFLIIILTAYLIGRSFKQKIGGFTGDTLGAANEMIELFILIIISMLGKGNPC